jgi:hypothetical protein
MYLKRLHFCAWQRDAELAGEGWPDLAYVDAAEIFPGAMFSTSGPPSASSTL